MTSQTIPKPEAVDAAAALRHGIALSKAGNLSGALETYRQVLAAQPNNAAAWHLSGLANQQLGDLNAAERMIRRADELQPGRASILSNLGCVLRDRGDLENAGTILRRAVMADDSYAPAHINLGHFLLQGGQLAEAVEAYRRATVVAPDYAEAWRNLGEALEEQGKMEAAIAAYRRVTELDPSDLDYMIKLGNLLRRAREFEEAKAVFNDVLTSAPNSAAAHLNLGGVHKDRGDHAGANESFRAAIAVDPDHVLAHRHLGFALLDSGDLAGAEESFRRAMLLDPEDPRAREQIALLLAYREEYDDAAAIAVVPSRRRPGPDTADGKINAAKIRHDLDQLRYLRDRDHLGPELTALLSEYERLSPEWLRREANSLNELTPAPSPTFRSAYNRLLHVAPAPPVAAALDPGLDVPAITTEYEMEGHAVVDGLLSESALASLRMFCLESTVWTHLPFRGELSATLGDGFSTPLLFQIAAELRRAFSAILGDHRLSYCWAYRYDGHSTGIEMHADDGTVSVNLWITPDEANQSPATGGLVLWPSMAPPHYFEEKDQAQKLEILKDTLRTAALPGRSVPYRYNRATIFRSHTIHRTADFNFGDSYEERRMNVTFMFGDRPKQIPQ